MSSRCRKQLAEGYAPIAICSEVDPCRPSALLRLPMRSSSERGWCTPDEGWVDNSATRYRGTKAVFLGPNQGSQTAAFGSEGSRFLLIHIHRPVRYGQFIFGGRSQASGNPLWLLSVRSWSGLDTSGQISPFRSTHPSGWVPRSYCVGLAIPLSPILSPIPSRSTSLKYQISSGEGQPAFSGVPGLSGHLSPLFCTHPGGWEPCSYSTGLPDLSPSPSAS